MRSCRAILVLLAAVATAHAQEPPNGPRHTDPRWHVFVHATVVPAPGERVDDGTVVVRDGRIVSIEAGAAAPAGARQHDLTGRWLYAAGVEPYLTVDAPKPAPDAVAAHWNEKVTPQRSVLDGDGASADVRAELRAQGFAAAALAPTGGVWRGTGAVVLLSEPDEFDLEQPPGVLVGRAFHTVGLEPAGGDYPRSLMGVVAVVRQTLLDAERHRRNRAVSQQHPEVGEIPADAALDALADDLPLWFEVKSELDVLTATRLATEAGRPCVVIGTGTEFRRLQAIADSKARLVLPVAFPDPPAVATLNDADAVDLRDLMTWEQAPTNPRRIAAAGLQAALTTHGLDDVGDFRERVERAIHYGLDPDRALAMVTTEPAKLLGVERDLGRIAPGAIANLVVTDGSLFDAGTSLLEVWVAGQRHPLPAAARHGLAGSWTVTGADGNPLGSLSIDDGELHWQGAAAGSEKVAGKSVQLDRDELDTVLPGTGFGTEGVVQAHAIRRGDTLAGILRRPDGSEMHWTAARAAAGDQQQREQASHETVDDVPEQLPVPFGAFGVTTPPLPHDMVIEHATVWAAQRRIIEDGAVVVSKGHIAWIGASADAPHPEGAEVIDATGKHLTPGLIDCHSHTGIRGGINEGTQAVTAEVRVADVLDPDDIAFYRELAGGVVMAHQLHGSANPIGGQNAVVRLRWGDPLPQSMFVRGATPTIKFALGENVKRSNGRGNQGRYPRTRMGIEALLRDRFAAAREYAQTWQEWRTLTDDERARRLEPRRDLELEALAEVLSGLRRVHCHAYRQDEILMLCRLSQELGFRIGAIQHGLEAYKVIEALRDANAGASVFSDWWAYKVEVVDAIPQNSAMLQRLGIVTSVNSDSDELARRLNTEAAKAVKYGGMPEAVALELVTLNPAIQLGVDDRTGSILRGKDADLALWSGNPLSSFSRCEATWIGGALYWSKEQDAALREAAVAGRQRLVQKVLAAGKRREEAKESADESGGDKPPKEGARRSHHDRNDEEGR